MAQRGQQNKNRMIKNNIIQKKISKKKYVKFKRRIAYITKIVILCGIIAIPIIIISMLLKDNNIVANDSGTDSIKYSEEDIGKNKDEQGHDKEMGNQNFKNLFKNLLPEDKIKQLKNTDIPDWIDEQIIEVDGTSRPGVELEDIRDIVVHYVGNPRTTAQQNHDYYQNDDSGVSSHFVVGLEGEIIQCIPLNEKSQANNWRNNDTISIEVCHPDTTGKFTEETYDSLVKLTAWLMDVCDLDEEHVIRHYDITGKDCPVYFVKNEDKWTEFKQDVKHKRDSQ